MCSLTRPNPSLFIAFLFILVPAAVLAMPALQVPDVEITAADVIHGLCPDVTATRTIGLCYTGDSPPLWTPARLPGPPANAPDIEVTPGSLSPLLCPNMMASEPVTICNTGDAPLTWVASERFRAPSPARRPLAGESAAPARGRPPVELGPAPQRGGQAARGAADPAPEWAGAALTGIPAYAVDVWPGENLVRFDPDDVGNWFVIGSVAGTGFFAGDMQGGSPWLMYVLDYYTNVLYWLDTETAATVPIGPAVPEFGEYWTGMASDPHGTLYAASSSLQGSTLYTVDPDTADVTPIGSITGAPCIISIAADYAGLYGLDMCSDELVEIDPDTGSATTIGPVGFNAQYAQSMDFESEFGSLYLAAFNVTTYRGELRLADLDTGNTTLIAPFPGDAEVDSLAFTTCCPGPWWMSESPDDGVVAPGACQRMDVEFLSFGIDPGDYHAELRILSDDPDEPAVALPVTMTVLADAAEIISVTHSIHGLEVAFDATVAGGSGLTYTWSFGDGGTSDEEDPVHAYTSGGCYTVTLEVGNGCSHDSWAGRVCVCEPVSGADFTWRPPTPMAGEPAWFTATVAAGTPPLTFAWAWGDGTAPGSGQSTTHAFASAGLYTVTVTVDCACGRAAATRPVTVGPRRFPVYLPLCVRAALPPN